MASTTGPGSVLQLLRDGRARTTAELIELAGLGRSTMSARVDQLLRAGLVRSAGAAASTGGRRPARVEFDPGAMKIVAVDLGATHAVVAATDLAGRVLASRAFPVRIADGPEPVLEQCTGAALELCAREDLAALPLAGVGIGVPGPVEHRTGTLIAPPIMPGWDGFDIPGWIGRTFDGPVLVDNDVNLLALGEHALCWPGVDDLVFVKVATGVGAGVIAGGALQRGAQGSAGDIGHAQVPRGRGTSRPADDERDLGGIASGLGIAASLREAGVEASGSADVVRLVREGDETAIALARQAGRDIGEVLATLVSILNPSVIVLGGSVANAGVHVLAGVREVVYGRSIPLSTRELTIVQSRAGDAIGVQGGALMVAQHVLAPERVDALLAG